MGVDTRPWMGNGFMLKKTDTPNVMTFEAIYDQILEMDEEEMSICFVTSDSYCGEWIFIGVSRYGDTECIERIPYGESGFLFSNGDDITIDVEQFLGKEHDFLKYATYGFYFGTDWT